MQVHQRWRPGYHRWSEPDIPAVYQQVAARQGFRDVLLEQLLRLLALHHGRDPVQQPLLQAGPNDNLCSAAGRLVIQVIDRPSCQPCSLQYCLITTNSSDSMAGVACMLQVAPTLSACLPAALMQLDKACHHQAQLQRVALAAPRRMLSAHQRDSCQVCQGSICRQAQWQCHAAVSHGHRGVAAAIGVRLRHRQSRPLLHSSWAKAGALKPM